MHICTNGSFHRSGVHWLLYRRTVHSLVVLLSNFDNVKLVYISPDGLEMPESIVQEVAQRNTSIKQITTMTLEDAVKVSHVLYVTRIQRERFDNQVTGYGIDRSA